MNEKTLYWSRVPGKFVNKNTGEALQVTLTEGGRSIGPAFNGSVREWYETLIETILDLRNQLHREAKTNSRQIKIYVDPTVRTILECSVLYKPIIEKSRPKSQIGFISGMDVFVSNKLQHHEIEMEFKAPSGTRRGKIVVQDINII